MSKSKHPEIKFAVNVLLAAAREAYGDSDATPASAYRFNVSPCGNKLEVMKAGLDWREFDLSTKEKSDG